MQPSTTQRRHVFQAGAEHHASRGSASRPDPTPSSRTAFLMTLPAWLAGKLRDGYELDPKLWAGLWLLERNPDGTPLR